MYTYIQILLFIWNWRIRNFDKVWTSESMLFYCQKVDHSELETSLYDYIAEMDVNNADKKRTSGKHVHAIYTTLYPTFI